MASENKGAIGMLLTALEMEEKGKAFYERAIGNCTNGLGREIFAMLEEEEEVHISRIKLIYELLRENRGWTGEWRKLGGHPGDLRPMFVELVNKHGKNIEAKTTDIEALSVGLDFEQKSVEYYEGELQKAFDAMEREFLTKMVAEEKNHFVLLTDVKYYLENPAGWYSEKERASYDGA